MYFTFTLLTNFISMLSNEIKSLISKNVFDSTPWSSLSAIPKIIIFPCQVIFDLRMNADGSINKYKARLVAQGNRQDNSTFMKPLLMQPRIKVKTYYLVLRHLNHLSYSVLISKRLFLFAYQRNFAYLKRPQGLDPWCPPIVKQMHMWFKTDSLWMALRHNVEEIRFPTTSIW